MREVGCKPKCLKVLAFALAMPLLVWANIGADTMAEPEVDAGIEPSVSPDAAPRVAQSRDLSADGEYAQAHKLPILLAFTADYCDYCKLLEEDFLKPMLISGHYQDKILIRKVVVDSSYHLTDFDGTATYADQFASRYKVRLFPTLLFLDSQGNELAERMIGINTPEFYGGYLDQNIDLALSRVRGSNPSNP